MKTPIGCIIALILVAVPLNGCAPAQTAPAAAVPATPASTVEIPTDTVVPSPSAVPSPTPLPGSLVLPVDTLGSTVPWLPLDKTAIPTAAYVGFNTAKAPFNSPTVRRAFAHAVDRAVLVEMAKRYRALEPVPATTLTPPQVLGRDLYGVVGAGFDPGLAKTLFVEAGYADPTSFPHVLFLVNASGDIAPGARFNMASAMADMWRTHLGVEVEVQAIATGAAYLSRLKENPPDLYWLAWAADYSDPDNFVGELFNPSGNYGGEYNYGRFDNSDFANLVNRASSGAPSRRQALYIEAERLLCETEAAIIPLYHYIIRQ